MKKIGFILMAAGLAIIVYFGYVFFFKDEQLVSPIPDDRGINVIFLDEN